MSGSRVHSLSHSSPFCPPPSPGHALPLPPFTRKRCRLSATGAGRLLLVRVSKDHSRSFDTGAGRLLLAGADSVRRQPVGPMFSIRRGSTASFQSLLVSVSLHGPAGNPSGPPSRRPAAGPRSGATRRLGCWSSQSHESFSKEAVVRLFMQQARAADANWVSKNPTVDRRSDSGRKGVHNTLCRCGGNTLLHRTCTGQTKRSHTGQTYRSHSGQTYRSYTGQTYRSHTGQT